MLINQQPAPFRHNLIERQLELRTAIAAQAVKYVARQALGMNANEQRPSRRTWIAQLEYYGLFRFDFPHAFEAEYAESSETGGKVRFSDLI